jgi:hypothetical protein
MSDHYLPPRDCQVLVLVDDAEVWRDVEFTQLDNAFGWNFADDQKPVDPESVVSWREKGAAS